MTPLDLFKAGKLDEAIAALGEELRGNPTDSKKRTFLFELLCFAGNYDRAGKQLDVLGQSGPQSEMGAVLYRALLQSTRTRQEVYKDRKPPASKASAKDGAEGGLLNGTAFETLEDADPRIGANLEVFSAGSYFLLPFSFLKSVEIQPPRRLRDLLWIPAIIRTTKDYDEKELGESFIPALTPFSASHPSETVRLGRETVWETSEDGESYPVGQKLWVVDGEELPILEVRRLEFQRAAAAS